MSFLDYSWRFSWDPEDDYLLWGCSWNSSWDPVEAKDLETNFDKTETPKLEQSSPQLRQAAVGDGKRSPSTQLKDKPQTESNHPEGNEVPDDKLSSAGDPPWLKKYFFNF